MAQLYHNFLYAWRTQHATEMFAHIKTGNPPRCPRPSASKQKKKMYTCINTHTRERQTGKGVLLINKGEKGYAICRKVNGETDHSVKWSKSDSERQLTCFISCWTYICVHVCIYMWHETRILCREKKTLNGGVRGMRGQEEEKNKLLHFLSYEVFNSI